MELPAEVLQKGILPVLLNDRDALDAFAQVSKAAAANIQGAANFVLSANMQHGLAVPRLHREVLTQSYVRKPFSRAQEGAAQKIVQRDSVRTLHAAQGRILQENGLKLALSFMAGAVEDFSNSSLLLIDYANLLSVDGQLKRAFQLSEASVASYLGNYDSAVVLQARAHIAVWRGIESQRQQAGTDGRTPLQRSMDHFRQAIGFWADNPQAHLHLWLCLLVEKNDTEALRSFRRALELTNSLADAH